MWTALAIVWVSSWSLSESLHTSEHPLLNQTWDHSEKNSSMETTTGVLNRTAERMTSATPSPVTLTRGTWGSDHTSLAVTAGTAHRTEVGTSAAGGTRAGAASRAPMPPAPASAWRTPSSPGSRAPGNSTASRPATAMPPATPTPATLATSAQPAAATPASVSSPTGSHGPPGPSASLSTASLMPSSPRALSVSTQGPTIQAPTPWTMDDMAQRPTPTLLNTTPKPASPSAASVSTTMGTTTKAPKPTVSTVAAPTPHTSPAPTVGATTPTMRPSPATSTPGAAGPGTTQTPEQAEPAAMLGTTSLGPIPGDSKVPPTDSCQPSTQGRYLLVSSEPLALSSVNRSFLLAVLLLGVTLFITVLILFALQAYESYRKKDYTQVDYLINGMYADSEM
uniref:Prostate androgen-regulated mucin-like protein 1 n=1 Tax=Moschus moschiferus TaxID=68415 RepID=A0A8C6G054_MOSMO